MTASTIVVTRVPLEFIGLSREQEKEASFKTLVRSVIIKGEAGKLPQVVRVDVSALKTDEVQHLRSITLPEGVVTKGHPSLALAQLVRK